MYLAPHNGTPCVCGQLVSPTERGMTVFMGRTADVLAKPFNCAKRSLRLDHMLGGRFSRVVAYRGGLCVALAALMPVPSALSGQPLPQSAAPPSAFASSTQTPHVPLVPVTVDVPPRVKSTDGSDPAQRQAAQEARRHSQDAARAHSRHQRQHELRRPARCAQRVQECRHARGVQLPELPPVVGRDRGDRSGRVRPRPVRRRFGARQRDDRAQHRRPRAQRPRPGGRDPRHRQRGLRRRQGLGPRRGPDAVHPQHLGRHGRRR